MNAAAEWSPKARMIVLLPESLAGNPELSRCMNAFANRENADVTYLVFLKDSGVILPVTRRMVTMKALTSNNELTVDFHLIVDDHKRKSLETFIKVTSQESITGRHSFLSNSRPSPCCVPFEMMLTPDVLDHQSLFEDITGTVPLVEDKAIIFTVKSHNFPKKRKEMQ